MNEATRLARQYAPECFRLLEEIAADASVSATLRAKVGKDLKRYRPFVEELAAAPDTPATDREYLNQTLDANQGQLTVKEVGKVAPVKCTARTSSPSKILRHRRLNLPPRPVDEL